MALLTDAEIVARLAEVPSWKREGDSIVREHTAADFASALQIVNAIASLAEEQNHHPDILIRYNRIQLTLSTHSAGGLTGKDFNLAAGIEAVLA